MGVVVPIRSGRLFAFGSGGRSEGPGRARAFASADTDYLSASHTIGAETTFSMAAWIKIDSTANLARNVMGLYSSDLNDVGLFEMMLTNSGVLRVRTVEDGGGGDNCDDNGATDLRGDGEWHLVCCARDGVNQTVWVDGGAGYSELEGRTFPTIDTVAIGCRVDLTPDQPFEGDIDECSLWEGTKLTDANAAAMYAIGIDSTKNYLASFSGSSIPTPTHHWSLSANTPHPTPVGFDEVGTLDLTDNGTADVEGIPAGEGGWTGADFALSFNGTNQYARDVTAFRTSDSVGTLSIWLKTSATSADVFFDVYQANGNRLSFYMTAAGYVAVSHATTGNGVYGDLTTINDDSWHHVMVTTNGSAWSIWVDGTAQTISLLSGSNAGDWIDSISPAPTVLLIANLGTLALPWDGEIDEVMYFNSTMDGTDATELTNSGTGVLASEINAGTLTSGKTPIHAWNLSRNSANGIGEDIGSIGGLDLDFPNGDPTDVDGIPAGQL